MPQAEPPAPGVLYIVATPIGNLEDITARAKRVLAEVDLVAAEDTRRTRGLLAHLGIDTRLESYHQHAERAKTAALIRRLKAGESIALVADAGVPVVSDPGAHLVNQAWENAIRVSPIPGPSAVLSALSVAGFGADRFLFAGYPPRKPGERRRFYAAIATTQAPAVVCEAPHRIKDSLDDAIAEMGEERMALVAREMTKRFEEFLRAPLRELRDHYDDVDPLGEFTIVFAPAVAAPSSPARGDVAQAAAKLVAAGVRTADAAEILADAAGIGRNDAYALMLSARAE